MKVARIHHDHHNHVVVMMKIICVLASLMASKVASVDTDFFPEEREALITLRESLSSNLLSLHATWTGPPCHKNHTNWLGISCRNSHVVSLVLDGLNLTGSLASTRFRNLSFLTELTVSNNSLSGPLPDLLSLERLEMLSFRNNRFSGPVPAFAQPSLTAFDVSGNRLSGEIPDTPVLRGFPSRCFAGNLGLCGKPLPRVCPSFSSERKKRRLGAWQVALIAGSVPVLAVVGVLLFYYRVVRGRENMSKEVHAEEARSAGSPKGKCSRSSDPEKGVEPEFLNKEFPAFDLDDLLQGSAEVLGKGALGTTYKTTLETGQSVAVKRLSGLAELGQKEFVQHMQLLGTTGCRHDNLVSIVSFYSSGDEKLVVSEFVPGGTLFQLLHENRGDIDGDGDDGRAPLSWETRLSIAKDIAKGLAFLHRSLPHHKVPHANLKSSNVLIAANFRVKLADFGFFPFSTSHKKCDKGCALAVARSPEHAQGKRVTRKSDVYCFGIVVLEIVTGKIPGEISPAAEDGRDVDLSDWVRAVVNKDWSTDILDAEIAEAREGHEEMLRLTEIALQCTDDAPEKRPEMSEVLGRIEEIEKNVRSEELLIKSVDIHANYVL